MCGRRGLGVNLLFLFLLGPMLTKELHSGKGTILQTEILKSRRTNDVETKAVCTSVSQFKDGSQAWGWCCNSHIVIMQILNTD